MPTQNCIAIEKNVLPTFSNKQFWGTFFGCPKTSSATNGSTELCPKRSGRQPVPDNRRSTVSALPNYRMDSSLFDSNLPHPLRISNIPRFCVKPSNLGRTGSRFINHFGVLTKIDFGIPTSCL